MKTVRFTNEQIIEACLKEIERFNSIEEFKDYACYPLSPETIDINEQWLKLRAKAGIEERYTWRMGDAKARLGEERLNKIYFAMCERLGVEADICY